MTTSKRKWLVTKANGETATIEATRFEDQQGLVKFFDGDDLVARFVGSQSVEPV